MNEVAWNEAQGQVLPPAAENHGSALAKIDKLTPEEIFIPGTLDSILTAIKDEVDRLAMGLKDMTVKANRDALRSLAMRVVKSRTFVEGQRKGLVSARKKQLADIDSEARRIASILEGIEDEVRAPLTAWEQAEKDRKAGCELILTNLQEWAKLPFGASSVYIQDTIGDVEAVDPESAQEFAHLAVTHKANTLKILGEALKVALEQEAQKAEVARLQAEANERAIRERERVAAEAAVEREKAESARREREAVERAEMAEKRRLEAEAQAERDKEAAVEAERKRVSQVAEDARLAAEARENNKKHRQKILNESRLAMLEYGSTEDVTNILQAIADGKIPHVSIAY
jgi:colicin import membrane protein